MQATKRLERSCASLTKRVPAASAPETPKFAKVAFRADVRRDARAGRPPIRAKRVSASAGREVAS